MKRLKCKMWDKVGGKIWATNNKCLEITISTPYNSRIHALIRSYMFQLVRRNIYVPVNINL